MGEAKLKRVAKGESVLFQPKRVALEDEAGNLIGLFEIERSGKVYEIEQRRGRRIHDAGIVAAVQATAFPKAEAAVEALPEPQPVAELVQA